MMTPKTPGSPKTPRISMLRLSKTTAVGLWAPGAWRVHDHRTATIMGRTGRVRAGAEVW